MKKVLTLISDKNYLEHCKSLFYSARNIGKWTGDLCLIANNLDDEDLSDFKKFNVEVIKINIENPYYANFYIFDFSMKKWDYVMYMDCDFTIVDDLNKIIPEDLILSECINVHEEPFKIHEYFCQGWSNMLKQESIKFLYEKYDLNKNGFNSSFFAFNTKIISEETFNGLMSMSKNLQKINNHTREGGTDQPIFNLYFNEKIKFIDDNKICFWKLSNEHTIAQHHCRWEAPWVNYNHSQKLNKTYIQNYTENLQNFYASIN